MGRLLAKSLYPRLGASQYQGMNIMRPFIGVDGLQIDHVANDMVFIRNTIAAEHIACCTCYVECFAAVIALKHGNSFGRGALFIT